MNIKQILPKFHFEVEHWKYYMPMDVYISSFGRFKDKEGNILTPTAKNNYVVFRGELVHRLVLTLFSPIPGCAGMTVDHLDHNTRNNKVSNLEWVSLEENQARNAADREANEKTMLQRTEETLASYKAQCASRGCIKLNGEIIPIDIACNILCNSKDLRACKTKIEKTFIEIKEGKTNATEIVIGNYKIELIKEEK